MKQSVHGAVFNKMLMCLCVSEDLVLSVSIFVPLNLLADNLTMHCMLYHLQPFLQDVSLQGCNKFSDYSGNCLK